MQTITTIGLDIDIDALATLRQIGGRKKPSEPYRCGTRTEAAVNLLFAVCVVLSVPAVALFAFSQGVADVRVSAFMRQYGRWSYAR